MLPTSGPDSPMPPGFVAVRPPGPTATRDRSTFWLGIGLLIPGLVLIVVVFGIFAASTGPDDYPIVPAPGRRSVELRAGSTYNLYVEYPGARSQERPPPVVHVTAPSGDEESLGDPDTVTPTYETISGGREGRAFASIHPAVTGDYRIEVEAVPGDQTDQMQVTVGLEASDAAAVLQVGVGLLGIGLVVAGATILIVRSVRRRRNASVAVAAGPGPPPAPPAPAVDWSPPDASERVED
jgi:hypothetical protein